MEEINIPKGIWKEKESYDNSYEQKIIDINCKDIKGITGHDSILTIWTGCNTISNTEIGISKLICDAGNTYQKCEILPSELLSQRNRLIEISKMVLDNTLNSNIKLQEYIKQITS